MDNMDNKNNKRSQFRKSTGRDKPTLPPEKLLSILRGMYPEEMAQEIFENLSKEGDENETDR